MRPQLPTAGPFRPQSGVETNLPTTTTRKYKINLLRNMKRTHTHARVHVHSCWSEISRKNKNSDFWLPCSTDSVRRCGDSFDRSLQLTDSYFCHCSETWNAHTKARVHVHNCTAVDQRSAGRTRTRNLISGFRVPLTLRGEEVTPSISLFNKQPKTETVHYIRFAQNTDTHTHTRKWSNRLKDKTTSVKHSS